MEAIQVSAAVAIKRKFNNKTKSNQFVPFRMSSINYAPQFVSNFKQHTIGICQVIFVYLSSRKLEILSHRLYCMINWSNKEQTWSSSTHWIIYSSAVKTKPNRERPQIHRLVMWSALAPLTVHQEHVDESRSWEI